VNILFLSSEVAPFAKTGGLGDVAGALPRYLRERGHDVRVAMPFYPRVRAPGRAFTEVLPTLPLTLGPRRTGFSVVSTPLPGSDVPVYCVRAPALFDRPSLYTSDADEHARFAGLTWAALKTCQHLQWSPDIVHCNDWQTALAPLALKTLLAWDRLFARTRTVLTIHNIGYQGSFAASALAETGFGEVAHHFHQDQLREGRVNALLTGILYADAITTVSPTYAREICTPEHGVGLDPFLRGRRDVLRGVLNGIDEAEWSPERDARIPHRYAADDLSGKERNKQELCRAMGLPYVPRVPVVGVVSRMAWQKGFDLCFDVLPHMLRRRAMQVVVLGTGEEKYERFFTQLADAFPRQVAYKRAFSEPVAHLIEAGSDMFLMPSRYEPCGLNQMYSLRYGTPPIVHRTGGLADTVRLWNPATQRGNGFIFDHFNDGGLGWALHRALETWGDGQGEARAAWRQLQRNGMAERFGWPDRVGEYEAIYKALVGDR
jgi:starch synthase